MCKYKPSKELYAMKVMNKARIFEYEIECQMANEIEIMNIIDHPNIIKLEYYFETKDELILILEYANNGTLFSRIKEREKYLRGKLDKNKKLYLDDQKIAKVILLIQVFSWSC
jgi:serine/threonine protein kinase